MFTQRLAINQNDKVGFASLVAKIARQLSVSVLKVIFRPAVAAVTLSAVPQCENGVCTISWKPQRPAA